MSRQPGAATPFGTTVVVVLALVACADVPGSPEATTRPASTSPTAADESWVPEATAGEVQDRSLSGLAFARAVDGTAQLFVVQPTGELFQLSDHRSQNPGQADLYTPRWAPDGSRIAYGVGFPPLNTWVVNADGSAPRLVSNAGIFGGWSPDGRELLVSEFSDVLGPGANLRSYAVDVETGDAREIVDRPAAIWLPDGRISYVRYGADGTPALHVLDPQTGRDDAVAATHSGTFSPDVELFAYAITAPECGLGAIAIANADGTGARTVACGMGPLWSPDGARIAYFEVVGSGPDQQLRLMTAEGQPIDVPDVLVQYGMAWSPDGSRLVVSSGSFLGGEPAELLLIDVATGEITPLGQGEQPTWSR